MDILLITYDVFDTVPLTEINYILGMRTSASNVQQDSLVKEISTWPVKFLAIV